MLVRCSALSLRAQAVASWFSRPTEPESALGPGCTDADDSAAEAAAASQLDRCRLTALDALPIGVIVADRHGEVVVRNRASATIGERAQPTFWSMQRFNTIYASARDAVLNGTQTLELHGPPRRVVVVARANR